SVPTGLGPSPPIIQRCGPPAPASITARISVTPKLKSANHQNSARRARPAKVAYFEKQVATAVVKSILASLPEQTNSRASWSRSKEVGAGASPPTPCRSDEPLGQEPARVDRGLISSHPVGEFRVSADVAPAVKVDAVGERKPPLPADRLQLGPAMEAAHMPDAKIGDRDDPFRQAEKGLERAVVEDRDPADAQPFGARGEPEVLHRADRREEVHHRNMRPPDHHRPCPASVAGDADVERRLEDALELQPAVGLAPLALEHQRRLGIRLREEVMHPTTRFAVAQDDEVPRLHEPDGG